MKLRNWILGLFLILTGVMVLHHSGWKDDGAPTNVASVAASPTQRDSVPLVASESQVQTLAQTGDTAGKVAITSEDRARAKAERAAAREQQKREFAERWAGAQALKKQGDWTGLIAACATLHRDLQSARFPSAGMGQAIWRELAELSPQYPQAKHLLYAFRDETLELYASSPGDFNVQHDLVQLNALLGEADLNIAILDSLAPDDFQRKAVVHNARQELIARGRYAEIVAVVSVEEMVDEFTFGLQHNGLSSVVESTLENIALLMLCDRAADAAILRAKLAGAMESAEVDSRIAAALTRLRANGAGGS